MNNTAYIPPQAIDIEEAILGALLIDDNAIHEIADIIFPEAFYKPQHKIIYQTIYNIFLESNIIDLLTVSDRLKKTKKHEKIGGDLYLINLTKKVASSAHIEFHARIILQKYIARQLIKNSQAIINHCYDQEKDVFDLLENAYDHLNQVSKTSIRGRESDFKSLMRAQIEKGHKIYKGEIKAGLTTPFAKLNNTTGGWRDGELIVLAARPSMGKTALALIYALHIAKQGLPVAFFSLEMSAAQLINRILSMEGRIDGRKFTNHGLSAYDLKILDPIEKAFQNLPFIIDDTASMTIEQLQIKAKRLYSKHNLKMIFVDYLQLMISKDKKGNRENEISKVSRGMKMIAKDLNIPVMALSQLNRSVETRGGMKRPMLSDLRESGAIEQDADMVQFLYRPEYYKIHQWDDKYNRQPAVGEAEYLVAKNRNGGLISNRMKFKAEYTLFEDIPDQDHYDFIPSKNTLPYKYDDNDNDEIPF